MAYALEKITAEDQERIISDAAQTLGSRRPSLVYARDYDQFPKTWAIDRQRNCYVLIMPKLVREEIYGTFLLFIDGQAYLIVFETADGRRAYFDPEAVPSPSQLEVVKREFVAGMAVYGQWGTGPC